MKNRYENLDLPDWFVRPLDPLDYEGRQQSLFQTNMDEWLINARVSRNELQRWCQMEWVSMASPCERIDFDDPLLNRIEVVRDLVRSGLSDLRISWLLSSLSQSSAAHPDRIAYSFRYGWVEPAPPQPFSIEDILGWIEDANSEDLNNLLSHIDSRFEQIAQEEAEAEKLAEKLKDYQSTLSQKTTRRND